MRAARGRRRLATRVVFDPTRSVRRKSSLSRLRSDFTDASCTAAIAAGSGNSYEARAGCTRRTGDVSPLVNERKNPARHGACTADARNPTGTRVSQAALRHAVTVRRADQRCVNLGVARPHMADWIQFPGGTSLCGARSQEDLKAHARRDARDLEGLKAPRQRAAASRRGRVAADTMGLLHARRS